MPPNLDFCDCICFISIRINHDVIPGGCVVVVIINIIIKVMLIIATLLLLIASPGADRDHHHCRFIEQYDGNDLSDARLKFPMFKGGKVVNNIKLQPAVVSFWPKMLVDCFFQCLLSAGLGTFFVPKILQVVPSMTLSLCLTGV